MSDIFGPQQGRLMRQVGQMQRHDAGQHGRHPGQIGQRLGAVRRRHGAGIAVALHAGVVPDVQLGAQVTAPALGRQQQAQPPEQAWQHIAVAGQRRAQGAHRGRQRRVSRLVCRRRPGWRCRHLRRPDAPQITPAIQQQHVQPRQRLGLQHRQAQGRQHHGPAATALQALCRRQPGLAHARQAGLQGPGVREDQHRSAVGRQLAEQALGIAQAVWRARSSQQLGARPQPLDKHLHHGRQIVRQRPQLGATVHHQIDPAWPAARRQTRQTRQRLPARQLPRQGRQIEGRAVLGQGQLLTHPARKPGHRQQRQ